MGDIAGPCLFAETMGISRSLYGKYGDRLDLIKFMIGSGVLAGCVFLLVLVILTFVISENANKNRQESQ